MEVPFGGDRLLRRLRRRSSLRRRAHACARHATCASQIRGAQPSLRSRLLELSLIRRRVGRAGLLRVRVLEAQLRAELHERGDEGLLELHIDLIEDESCEREDLGASYGGARRHLEMRA